MSRILALEWDDHELRYLLAAKGKNRAKLISAGSQTLSSRGNDVPFPEENESSEDSDSDQLPVDQIQPEISDVIKNALKGEKLSKAVCLVNVKRSQVEFIQLELPPVSDKELTAMVRNQAMLESPAINDESIVDYYSPEEEAGLPRNVMAASIQETALNHIQSTMILAGLHSKRYCLRTFSSASLAESMIQDIPGVAFVINCVNQEVDIMMLKAGKLHQMRSVRLAEDSHDPKSHSQILRELKRMIMLSPKPSADEEESTGFFLFGLEEEYPGLKEVLETELNQEVEFLDPFTQMRTSTDRIPHDTGKYASLISLVLQEARDEAPPIDFLNPKKPPKPPNKQRQYLTYAAAVIAVVGSGYYLYWETVGQLNSDIKRMKAQLKDRTKQNKTIEAEKSTMASIKDWEKGDVNWLDELRDLSIRFPNAQDIVIQRMTLSSSKKGGGTISMDGLARSPSVVGLMEQNIRDDFHQIQTRSVKEQLRDKEYSWLFGTDLSIKKRSSDQYVSHIPEHLRPKSEDEKKEEKDQNKKVAGKTSSTKDKNSSGSSSEENVKVTTGKN